MTRPRSVRAGLWLALLSLLVASLAIANPLGQVSPASAESGSGSSGSGSGGGSPTNTPLPTATRTSTPTPTATQPGGATAAATSTPTATAVPQVSPTSNALTINETSVPNGNVGTEYTAWLTARGGEGGPVEFSVVVGSLPAGLSMIKSFGVTSGGIHGTPTRAETKTFTVEVRDKAGNTARRTFTLTIDPPLPLVITNGTSTLTSGVVGQPYANSLFASGGIQPYSWAIVAGQLPPGLRLSGNTISGTPTTPGTFTFTARVSDNGGQQASQQFSITVS
jgi:hypothetical protein